MKMGQYLMSITISKPVIGEEELKAIEEIIRSGMLSQGKAVHEFEKKFSEYIGVKNSIAVCNGTLALDLRYKRW